ERGGAGRRADGVVGRAGARRRIVGDPQSLRPRIPAVDARERARVPTQKRLRRRCSGAASSERQRGGEGRSLALAAGRYCLVESALTTTLPDLEDHSIRV